MNNYELNQKLLNEARIYVNELKEAYRIKEWNIVMRKSQEVVELSLKSVLKLIGIDYPKEHDVGKVFSKACREKGIEISTEILKEIEFVSEELYKHRAPAFYFDEIYTESQATWAKEKSEKIFNFINDLVKKLKSV